MRAPTRALILEDTETWVYILDRAARRAGVNEVVTCGNLTETANALRAARFDIAILDIGLDPDDDLNADGIAALEMIRKADGGETRCVLVTGWQGGDRMDLQSDAQYKYGLDWAFMKEKYDAHGLVAKLTELLERAAMARLDSSTPMENLRASVEPFEFEQQLLRTLSPGGGIQTLYAMVSRLLGPAIPLVALHPNTPMKASPDDGMLGVYWSRSLATAVAVGLAPAKPEAGNEEHLGVNLGPFVNIDVTADLIERVRERNLLGSLWEIPELGRDKFPER